MVATFSQQFRTIFLKNLKSHFRSRSFLRELINIGIIIAVIAVLDKTGGQNSNNSASIPFYMSIAITLFSRGVAITWVGERESRQTEVQKIMGTSNAAYYSGWLVFNILNGVYISLLFIGILEAIGLFSESTASFGQILGLYFLYLISTFSFVLLLSAFFNDSLLAAQIITFVQILSSMLYFLIYIDAFRASEAAMQVTSILPTICFEFTMMKIGVGSNAPLFETPFTQTQGFITLGATAAGYFVLFIYLSLVLPNENGSNLHPLFFLDWCKVCCKKEENKSSLQQSFELVNLTSARYHEQIKNQKKVSMYFKHLKKSFDEKVVVNNLSLSLFEGQIFCLLGHNGAGKSTTINMLTGILKPDQGVINMFGYDYYSQKHLIRSKTGVCLQTDVLYQVLTVRQHFQFYARLKGVDASVLNQHVDQMLGKCGLLEEQGKRAKELSGGNKRKTCLGCAAIGDSQLLFLDQPSSGLDPNSRRIIWNLMDILRKQGRTIILTTHHLEEAQALANQIGILAHGEMLVQGSCHYIKDKFGCGYYLEIALNSQRNLEEQRMLARQKVHQLIQAYREDEQVNEVSMRFLLPNNQQQNFAALFHFLETQGFVFSLKLSSLEDVFIKIGMDVNSIMSNEPLPELERVQLPQYEPVYRMSAQIKQIFIKKFYTTIRSPSIFFSVLLPVIFIIVGIVVTMEAFQPSDDPRRQVIVVWSRYYTLAAFFALAFALNTGSYCGSLVKERQIHFKYLSYVMGMKKAAYWIGTTSFDVIMFCIPLGLIFLVIGVFPQSQSGQFVSSFGWLALTLIIFSFSFLPFTYLWSFAFEKSSTAYRFFPFLVYILFYIVPSIFLFLWPDAKAIQYILPITSPLLGLNACIMSKEMLGETNYQDINAAESLYDVKLFTQEGIWYPLIIMALQGIIFFVLVFVIDNLKFNLNDRQEVENEERRLSQSQDLIKEKAKIAKGNKEPIIVDSLYKKYPNGFVAVKDNTFVVEKGQTFGLLGPNGAGKSTTFNILTAAIPKTHGYVMLDGYQVNRAVSEIFTTVGVCPQFNPLYDQMTTAEHLDFFAGLKGMTGEQKQEIIKFYSTHLQLEEYKDVRSTKLSGGNKRKLCVAMSLVGNPSLLFLDEPSAGVDPIARRFLWNVLHSSSAAKNKSIVLTTHSINQAESLCNRIGILIKGEFYCIGTPIELKQRYGKGYRATLVCESQEKLAKVRATVREHFVDYTEEVFEGEMRICFQFSKQNFIFSKAFQLFYNIFTKQKLVEQFQMSETTLEEVFIYLSRMQVERQFNPKDEKVSNFCCCEKNSAGCFCLC